MSGQSIYRLVFFPFTYTNMICCNRLALDVVISLVYTEVLKWLNQDVAFFVLISAMKTKDDYVAPLDQFRVLRY
jgi:hypothetical protein